MRLLVTTNDHYVAVSQIVSIEPWLQKPGTHTAASDGAHSVIRTMDGATHYDSRPAPEVVAELEENAAATVVGA